jgi:leucyl-tRNA synthetase
LLDVILRNLVLLISPFAPYLANELWEKISLPDVAVPSALLRHRWPDYNPELAKEEEIEYVVQINGKVKARLTVAAETTEDIVREQALADQKVRAALEGKQIVKVIVVSGKLVNIVVR